MFCWQPAARFDTVFFAFWLSHVPASRFGQFWRQLRGLLTRQGQVLYVAGSDEIIRRQACPVTRPVVLDASIAPLLRIGIGRFKPLVTAHTPPGAPSRALLPAPAVALAISLTEGNAPAAR